MKRQLRATAELILGEWSVFLALNIGPLYSLHRPGSILGRGRAFQGISP